MAAIATSLTATVSVREGRIAQVLLFTSADVKGRYVDAPVSGSLTASGSEANGRSVGEAVLFLCVYPADALSRRPPKVRLS